MGIKSNMKIGINIAKNYPNMSQESKDSIKKIPTALIKSTIPGKKKEKRKAEFEELKREAKKKIIKKALQNFKNLPDEKQNELIKTLIK